MLEILQILNTIYWKLHNTFFKIETLTWGKYWILDFQKLLKWRQLTWNITEINCN